MTSRRTTGTVQDWAEAILHQLGDPAFRSLNVERTEGRSHEQGEPGSTPMFVSQLQIIDRDELANIGPEAFSGILVMLVFEDGSSAGARLEDSLSDAEAVVKLAEQLQDSVLEATGGLPFPPCPGHVHPAVAELINGIASWTCPKDGPLRPIIEIISS